MASNSENVYWKIWQVNEDVLGIVTVQAKPQYFAFNCGRDWCEYVVLLHNRALAERKNKSDVARQTILNRAMHTAADFCDDPWNRSGKAVRLVRSWWNSI
jgi:hypothetical protein